MLLRSFMFHIEFCCRYESSRCSWSFDLCHVLKGTEGQPCTSSEINLWWFTGFRGQIFPGSRCTCWPLFMTSVFRHWVFLIEKAGPGSVGWVKLYLDVLGLENPSLERKLSVWAWSTWTLRLVKAFFTRPVINSLLKAAMKWDQESTSTALCLRKWAAEVPQSECNGIWERFRDRRGWEDRKDIKESRLKPSSAWPFIRRSLADLPIRFLFGLRDGCFRCMIGTNSVFYVVVFMSFVLTAALGLTWIKPVWAAATWSESLIKSAFA